MTEHPTTQSRIADGRDEVIELAYRPWQLIGAGRLEDGLALLDDSGHLVGHLLPNDDADGRDQAHAAQRLPDSSDRRLNLPMPSWSPTALL